ncbi:MAG TPA: hypothetical protein VG328_03345 [Stellaceae bacterium]|jgi:hypothetical protein|nr:hypothetical protein [Stellaceae bacterium]
MQAGIVKDMATAAPRNLLWRDRAWQRSLGASCALHGAVVAALLVGWHIEPKPFPELRPIPVTLIRSGEIAPQRAVQPAPEPAAPPAKKVPAKPAAPVVAAAKPAHSSAPPAKRPRVMPPIAKPARPPATPKPNATVAALLSESLDGRPQTSAASRSAAVALRQRN